MLADVLSAWVYINYVGLKYRRQSHSVLYGRPNEEGDNEFVAVQFQCRPWRDTSTLALVSLVALLHWTPAFAAATSGASYPAMAAVRQHMMPRAEEIALATSAAPASISNRAEVLVLGKRGYETAVKGNNGFVCFVGRSGDLNFTDPELWNPKVRTPQCDNVAAAHSVLPRYLTRTEWVLAGVSKAEMQRHEAAEWASGKLKEPEPGAVSYMMSKGGYINDSVGHWYPHVMFFTPHMSPARWGLTSPDCRS